MSVGSAFFGSGTKDTPIWLDGVSCTGGETTLEQCMNQGWGATNCKLIWDCSAFTGLAWQLASTTGASHGFSGLEHSNVCAPLMQVITRRTSASVVGLAFQVSASNFQMPI